MKYMELLEQIEVANEMKLIPQNGMVEILDYFEKRVKVPAQRAQNYFRSMDLGKLDQVVKNKIATEIGERVEGLTNEKVFRLYIRSTVRKIKGYNNKSDDYIFAKTNEKLSKKIPLTFAEKRFFQLYLSELGKLYLHSNNKDIFDFCDAIIGTGTMTHYKAVNNTFSRSSSVSFNNYLKSQIVAVEMKYDSFPENIQPYIEKQKAYDNLDVDAKKNVCAMYLKQNYGDVLKDHHIYAILANMSYESRFSTYVSGDKGTSDGLCQWHDPSTGKGRLTNLKIFSNERNMPWNYFGVQLDFLIHEIQNKFPEFLQLNDKADASKITTIVDGKRVKLFNKDELNKDSLYIHTKYFVYNFESPTNKRIKFNNQRLPQAREYEKKGIMEKPDTLNLITPPIQI